MAALALPAQLAAGLAQQPRWSAFGLTDDAPATWCHRPSALRRRTFSRSAKTLTGTFGDQQTRCATAFAFGDHPDRHIGRSAAPVATPLGARSLRTSSRTIGEQCVDDRPPRRTAWHLGAGRDPDPDRLVPSRIDAIGHPVSRSTCRLSTASGYVRPHERRKHPRLRAVKFALTWRSGYSSSDWPRLGQGAGAGREPERSGGGTVPDSWWRGRYRLLL